MKPLAGGPGGIGSFHAMAGDAEGFDPQVPLRPADPPSCPEGWSVGPPDFVGVGAQRCGTSWWHRLIVAHPDVCFNRELHTKEVHFFDALGEHAPLSPE